MDSIKEQQTKRKVEMKMLVLLSVIIAGPVFATGGGGHSNDDCNGVLNCNDVEVTDESNNNRNEADADADSRSSGVGVGVGIGEGGDARANGGSAVSGSRSSGGDADANSGVENSGNSRNSNRNVAEGGAGGESDSHSSASSGSAVLGSGNSGSSSGATVDASDNSSYSSSYRYEEAAKSAAILYGQVCSDVTNIQGVKFGIASSKQSEFCMRLTVAQGFYAAASMLQCADAESVGKGAAYIRSPSPSACERQQHELYLEGTKELRKASALVDGKKTGWIHKLWNTVVW